MDEPSVQWSPLAKSYDPLKCGSIDGTDSGAHDKAVLRAMRSSYRPNKGVTGDKYNTLFIGRLNHKTEESSIIEVFSRYGRIKRARLVRDIVTGYSKGYAYVEYEDSTAVKDAHRHAHGMQIDGCAIVVDFEHERTMPGWVPRRLGGGFGGKKESGQLRFGCRDRPFRKPLHHGTRPTRTSKEFGYSKDARSMKQFNSR